MLAGPGGVHKSRTLVHWGLSISAGAPVYGRATAPARFEFLSYEDSYDEVTRRAQAMTQRLGSEWGDNAGYWDMSMTPEPFAVVSDDGIQVQPFYRRFREHLLATPGHKFVGLDSMYNVFEFRGQAKINEPSVKAAIELLNRLCRETDSTIVFLWHPSQAGQEREDASGWSVAWHNAPRARVSLSSVKDGHGKALEGAFELKVVKRNNGPKGAPLTLHWDAGVLLPITDVSAAEQAGLYFEAVIKVAIDAANFGAPITTQKNLFPWQLQQIEAACGKRPTQGEVKAELQRALMLKRLRYAPEPANPGFACYRSEKGCRNSWALSCTRIRFEPGNNCARFDPTPWPKLGRHWFGQY